MSKSLKIFLVVLLLLIPIYMYNNSTGNDSDKHLSHVSHPEQLPKELDPSRYLAHAGGEIDGDRYTNSLEAINHNYQNGFRYFEIDIIKTSDGHLVAAHDWDSWKRYTNFEGKLPPTLDEFLQLKIKNKYTPVTFLDLGPWLENHPNALIFTDKLNQPQLIPKEFKHTDRLIMKLVSFSAVKKAQEMNIKCAFAENLLDALAEDKVAEFNKWNITRVVVSRKNIEEKKELLLQLKDAGIKTYASHVNFERGKDEAYVFHNEMKYIYGFYADRWNFEIPEKP